MRTLLTLTALAAGLAGCVAPPPVAIAPSPVASVAPGPAAAGTPATPGTAPGTSEDGTPVQVPLVAVPGPGKTQAQFAADDMACRSAPAQAAGRSRAAAAEPGTSFPSLAQGGQPVGDSPGVGYLRCMASRNNTVEPIEEPQPLPVYGYYPAYPVYAGYDYGFPVFYDDFFGLGFYYGFGGFYHRGFYRGFYGYGRGFDRGGYGRFGGPGYGYGGFRGGPGFDRGFDRGGFDRGGFGPGGGFRGGPGFGGGGFRGSGGGFGGGFHGR